jgi:biopolymer transport protein ExbD
MRTLMFVALVLVGMGSPALAADPVGKISVEISAHKDVDYAALRAVLSAARDSGVPAQISLRVGETRGISVRIRVSPNVPYRDLAGLLDALNKAGVARIQLSAP